MPKLSSSTNPLRLLADAWVFLRSQPALFSVLLWFIILPTIALDAMKLYWPVSDAPSIDQIGQIGYVLATILISVVLLWGFACVLLVGKRMVKSLAGRARTSFRSVRRESIRLILPLFFTGLLRSVITLEWALVAIIPAILFLVASQDCRATFSPLLSAIGAAASGSAVPLRAILPILASRCGPLILVIPLLLPAAIYQVRTFFYAIVLVAEGLRYRDALKRSRTIVRGRFWRVVWIILALGIIVFLPTGLLAAGIDSIRAMVLPDLPIASLVANDMLGSLAGLLFTLALVALYGKLKKEKGRVQEVVPE